MVNYCLRLYYKENIEYLEDISKIFGLMKEISESKEITIKLTKFSTLSEQDIERLKMEIRNISPQIRGKVVTSKGYILPFSKNKNLNLDNTPILVLLFNNQLINVYPHQLGTHYINILSFLETVNKEGIPNESNLKGLLEEPIIRILSENPSILEKDITYYGSEIDLGIGKPDVIFIDSKGRFLVVEVENQANDFAIGQVSRGATGLIKRDNLDPKKVRKAIVCLSLKRNITAAAKSAGIEVYQFRLDKLA